MEQASGQTVGRAGLSRQGGLSGGGLKLIAIGLMFLDHVGAVVLERMLLAAGLGEAATSEQVAAFLAQNGALYWADFALRMAGRLAFPIFCFLLVEGFLHTRSAGRYALRLSLFALVSEIPFDLATSGPLVGQTTWWNPAYQNVFFTLLCGLLTLWAMDCCEKRGAWPAWGRLLAQLGACAAGMAAAVLLRADYDFTGVLAIVLFYLLRRRRTLAGAAGCAALLTKGIMEAAAFLSLLPISLYNGRRGPRLKYFFYAFYPAHLLALWLVCVLMGIA